MKIILIAIGVLSISAVIFGYSKYNSKKSKSVVLQAHDNDVETDTLNNYNSLRSLALVVKPEQLKLKLNSDIHTVFGVVMDWEMGGAIVTVLSFATGDASVYVSSGGGFIGGGQHENVSSASKALVVEAGKYLDKAIKTDTTPLPLTGCIKFYLLTNKGIYVGEEKMKNIEGRTSKWHGLFVEANKVISELRIVSEK